MSPPLSLRQQRILAVIETIPLLAGLEPRDAVRVCDAARMRRYAAGEVVIERGDPPHALYAVATGRLKVVSPRPDARDATLSILGPGEVFGEIAMFRAGGRSARVSALEESVVMILDRVVFMALLEEVPAIARRLLDVMATRLHHTIHHLDDNALGVSQRLARKLLSLAENFGTATADGLALDLKLSQRDLGALVDSSRQTVNRQLRAWAEAKWLRFDQGRLVLLNLDAIRGVAHGDRGAPRAKP